MFCTGFGYVDNLGFLIGWYKNGTELNLYCNILFNALKILETLLILKQF